MQSNCSECFAALVTDAMFCPVCGAPTSAKRCSKCGERVDEDGKFCKHCGASASHSSHATEGVPKSTSVVEKPINRPLIFVGLAVLVGVVLLFILILNISNPQTTASSSTSTDPNKPSKEAVQRDCDWWISKTVGSGPYEGQPYMALESVDLNGVSTEGATAQVIATIHVRFLRRPDGNTGLAKIPAVDVSLSEWSRDGTAAPGGRAWIRLFMVYRKYDTGWRLEFLDSR